MVRNYSLPSSTNKGLKTIETPKPVTFAITLIIIIITITVALSAFSLAPSNVESMSEYGTVLGESSMVLKADFENNFDNTATNGDFTFQSNYLTTFNTTTFLTTSASVQNDFVDGDGIGYAIYSYDTPATSNEHTSLVAFKPSRYAWNTVIASETRNVSPILEQKLGNGHVGVQYVQQGMNEYIRVAYITDNQYSNEDASELVCNTLPILNEWNTLALIYNSSSGNTRVTLNNISCSGIVGGNNYEQGLFNIGGLSGLTAGEAGTVGQYDCFTVFNQSLAPETITEWNSQVLNGTCPNNDFATFIPAENNNTTFSFMSGILALTLIIVIIIFIKKGMTQ